MKTMTAMQVRRHFGEVMDNVRLKAESVVLERAGKPVAMIVPFMPENSGKNDTKTFRKNILDNAAGIGRHQARARNIAQWLDNERSLWNEQ